MDEPATSANAGDARPEKLAYRIDEAVAATGIGRTSLYALIRAGNLHTRKMGARTLIEKSELVRVLKSLPRGDEVDD